MATEIHFYGDKILIVTI